MRRFSRNLLLLRHNHNINYNPADPWISPIHHLLAILPSTSLSLVPPEARHLFLPGSPIAYMYPNSFFVELEGLFKEHEARILVPFANIDEIVKVIGEFNLLTYGDVLVNTADEYPENLILQRTLDIEELRSQLDEDTEIIEREKMRQRKLKEEIGICKKRSSGPGRGRGSGRGGFGRGSQSRGFSDRGRGRGFGRGSQGYQGKVTNPRESPKIEIKKPALVKYTTATKNITNGCTWNKNLKF